MNFSHAGTEYQITSGAGRGEYFYGYWKSENQRNVWHGVIWVEDTPKVVRAYHAYFLDRYGMKNLATDDMVRLERQWDADGVDLEMVRERDETYDAFLAGTGRV